MPGRTRVAFITVNPLNNPVLRYTALRLALFLGALAVLYLLQMRGVWLLLTAVLVSGIASLVLLSGPRDAMSGAVSGRVQRVRERLDEDARVEDDD